MGWIMGMRVLLVSSRLCRRGGGCGLYFEMSWGGLYLEMSWDGADWSRLFWSHSKLGNINVPHYTVRPFVSLLVRN